MVYGTHSRHREHGSQSGSFRDLADTVSDALLALRSHADEFDAIVVTGVSGAVVGSPVALALDKELLVLRKPNDDCHGNPGALLGGDPCEKYAYRRNLNDKRVLFLDDFVSGGTTRERCRNAVEEKGGKIVTQFEYLTGGTQEYHAITFDPSGLVRYGSQ
jgi:adenine/guanine phosphoribosyltransferase-like PRPP-binding protein